MYLLINGSVGRAHSGCFIFEYFSERAENPNLHQGARWARNGPARNATFVQLISNFYIANNDTLELADKFAKVRPLIPLFKMLNERYDLVSATLKTDKKVRGKLF